MKDYGVFVVLLALAMVIGAAGAWAVGAAGEPCKCPPAKCCPQKCCK